MAARFLTRCGRSQTSLLQVRQNFPAKKKLFAAESRKIQHRNPTIMERLYAPASGNAIMLGKCAAAGASAFALGSLFYYGSDLLKNLGAIDTQVAWPEIVRQRIKSTYIAFGASIVLTAVTAAVASRFSILVHLISKYDIATFFGLFFGTWFLIDRCLRLPYTEEFGKKHLVWMSISLFAGVCICPVASCGGAIVAGAVAYMAGIVGGLSALAFCAPSDKFLYIGGPLVMGCAVVYIASFGSLFVPMFTALGSGLYSTSVFGGLVVFGGCLLYKTQQIIDSARKYPINSEIPYDPIDESIALYTSTMNTFLRVLDVCCRKMGSRRRR